MQLIFLCSFAILTLSLIPTATLATDKATKNPSRLVSKQNLIHFQRDKIFLTPENMALLKTVADTLNANPKTKLILEAHTDNRGSSADNLKLSKEMANAVLMYLVSYGVYHERISSKSYGDARPVASNSTEEGRKMNRRVELLLMP